MRDRDSGQLGIWNSDTQALKFQLGVDFACQASLVLTERDDFKGWQDISAELLKIIRGFETLDDLHDSWRADTESSLQGDVFGDIAQRVDGPNLIPVLSCPLKVDVSSGVQQTFRHGWESLLCSCGEHLRRPAPIARP